MADGFKFETGTFIHFMHQNKAASDKVVARRRVDVLHSRGVGYDERNKHFGEARIEYATEEHGIVAERDAFETKAALLASL